MVSSLNAPSLFLIAKDLSRMQIWASVNEADIGQIRPGQTVSFTVGCRPEAKFTGEVAQIRLNATMTQNVVTYTVVVNFDNSKIERQLRPYLTANLSSRSINGTTCCWCPMARCVGSRATANAPGGARGLSAFAPGQDRKCWASR